MEDEPQQPVEDDVPPAKLQREKKPRSEAQLAHLEKLATIRKEKAAQQNEEKAKKAQAIKAEEDRQAAILAGLVEKKAVKLTKSGVTKTAKRVAAAADEEEEPAPPTLLRAKKEAPAPVPAQTPAPISRIRFSADPPAVISGSNIRFL
jgi:hypothetical protein